MIKSNSLKLENTQRLEKLYQFLNYEVRSSVIIVLSYFFFFFYYWSTNY